MCLCVCLCVRVFVCRTKVGLAKVWAWQTSSRTESHILPWSQNSASRNCSSTCHRVSHRMCHSVIRNIPQRYTERATVSYEIHTMDHGGKQNMPQCQRNIPQWYTCHSVIRNILQCQIYHSGIQNVPQRLKKYTTVVYRTCNGVIRNSIMYHGVIRNVQGWHTHYTIRARPGEVLLSTCRSHRM